MAVHMASSKNSSIISKKRVYDDATVSSPTSESLTQDGRNSWKKHKPSSFRATADTAITSAPEQYKNAPPHPVTSSGDLCRLLCLTL